jgi:hypothetical protein
MPDRRLWTARLALEMGDPLSERDFQLACEAEAEACGFELLYHVKDSRLDRRRGFPDLILAYAPSPARGLGGRVIVAELKVPPNRPTEEQYRWLRAFAAVGLETYLWYPRDWPQIKRILAGDVRFPGQPPDGSGWLPAAPQQSSR